MQIPKPTDADRDRFQRLVADAPGVETRPMFGNLGAFVNGNMFMGLFGAAIGIKLPDGPRDKLLAQPGAGPFRPAERPMSGYATLPAGWSARKAAPWIDLAFGAATALLPKAPRRKPARKARA